MLVFLKFTTRFNDIIWKYVFVLYFGKEETTSFVFKSCNF